MKDKKVNSVFGEPRNEYNNNDFKLPKEKPRNTQIVVRSTRTDNKELKGKLAMGYKIKFATRLSKECIEYILEKDERGF